MRNILVPDPFRQHDFQIVRFSPYVDNMDQRLQRLPFGEVFLYHRFPFCYFRFITFGESVAGEICEDELFVYFEKIDRAGLSR